MRTININTNKNFLTLTIAICAALLLSQASLATTTGQDFRHAMKLYNSGHLNGAKKVLTQIILDTPSYWPAHYQLANIYLLLGQNVEAELHYIDCLKLGCDSTTAVRARQAINHINRLNPENTKISTTVNERKLSSELNKVSKIRLSNARAASNMEKARVMSEARDKVARIQASANHELKQMEQNSAWWYYNTGSGKMVSVVDPEQAQAIKADAEQYAQEVLDEANQRAKAIKPPTQDDVTTGLQSQLTTHSRHSTIRIEPQGTSIFVRNYKPIKKKVANAGSQQ